MAPRPKIVVLDGRTLSDLSWDAVAAHGELVVHQETSPSATIERAQGAAIVLTNKVRLDAATIVALPDLRFVGVLATGYDVVDVEAARQHDVIVSNVPAYATDSVAQHVFALLLELTNRAAEHDRAVRDGQWASAGAFTFWNTRLTELRGKTLGVVGYGRIGRRVAEIGRAFGMQVVSATRSATPEQGVTFLSVDELFQTADVVSLNCALTGETNHMVDKRRLADMKPGALLINTSRGALVDNDALADALDHGPLGGAALDVVDGEPIDASHALFDQPRNLIVTPHNAWTSHESRSRLMAVTAQNVASFVAGSPVNVVS
jgi:glycerate dehydrogenase